MSHALIHRRCAFMDILMMLTALLAAPAGGLPLPDQDLDAAYVDADYAEYSDDAFNDVMERLQVHVGPSLFGEPSTEAGERVSRWTPKSPANPEELGAYTEGDILFPASRNGVRLQSARWPGGVIYYKLAPGFPEDALRMIQAAVDTYHRYTCLRFVPVSETHTHTDYLEVTHTDTGCWSAVGRVGGPQQLNLQTPGCTSTMGTVLHELMHAAGFLHEQNRYERDAYITVNWSNIQEGREVNFQAASQHTTYAYGVPYDYNSVMHYSAYAFSKNGLPTLTAKEPNVKMGQRLGFSIGDILKINRMYQHICRKRDL